VPELTKAQKAAKAGVKHMLMQVSIGIKINKDTYPKERIFSILNDIEESIKEYDLDDNFLADYVEKTYDALIKKRRYLDAAAIAKKYGI
jgi:hypothetical protein